MTNTPSKPDYNSFIRVIRCTGGVITFNPFRGWRVGGTFSPGFTWGYYLAPLGTKVSYYLAPLVTAFQPREGLAL